MPVMQVRRIEPLWSFCSPAHEKSSPGEHPSQTLAKFLEDLEAICSGEVADFWEDIPDKQQRKLRITQ